MTNLEIQKLEQNALKFKCTCLQYNLPKTMKDEANVNLDEYKSMGTYWVTLYVNGNNVAYFDSYGVEKTSKEIRKSIINKNIITNVFKMQTHLIISRYICIGFIDFMLKGNRLI